MALILHSNGQSTFMSAGERAANILVGRDVQVELYHPTAAEITEAAFLITELRLSSTTPGGRRISVQCPYLPGSHDAAAAHQTRAFLDIMHILGVKEVHAYSVPDHVGMLSRALRLTPLETLVESLRRLRNFQAAISQDLCATSPEDFVRAARIANAAGVKCHWRQPGGATRFISFLTDETPLEDGERVFAMHDLRENWCSHSGDVFAVTSRKEQAYAAIMSCKRADESTF